MKSFALLTLLIGLTTLSACKKVDSIADNNYHKKPVGESANDLLSTDRFTSLHIEISYVAGNKPTNATIDNLKAFLGKYLNKPQGITVALSEIASPGLAPYSIEDINAVESSNRTSFNNGNKLGVWVFFADGNYSESDNVLGVAYKTTSMALFASRIDELSGGVGQPSQTLLETTVLNHEFGHIMGLVNVGTDLQSDHQDDARGHHCDVDDCLMYWTAETGDIVTNLLSLSSAPDLDSQCQADLKANGGK